MDDGCICIFSACRVLFVFFLFSTFSPVLQEIIKRPAQLNLDHCESNHTHFYDYDFKERSKFTADEMFF